MPKQNDDTPKKPRRRRRHHLPTPVKKLIIATASVAQRRLDTTRTALSDVSNERNTFQREALQAKQQLAVARQENESLIKSLESKKSEIGVLRAHSKRAASTISKQEKTLDESEQSIQELTDKADTETVKRQAAVRKSNEASSTLKASEKAFKQARSKYSSVLEAAILARDEAQKRALAAEKSMQDAFLDSQNVFQSIPASTEENSGSQTISELTQTISATHSNKHTQGWISLSTGGLGLLLSLGGTSLLAAQTPAVSFMAALGTLNSGALIGAGIIAGLSLALLILGVIKLRSKKPNPRVSHIESPLRSEPNSLGCDLQALEQTSTQ